jgi:hypothetical protein
VTGTGLYTTWVRVGVTTQAVRLLTASGQQQPAARMDLGFIRILH